MGESFGSDAPQRSVRPACQRMVEIAGATRLTGTLLAVFKGSVKPALQDSEGLGFYFEKGDAGSEIGLHVNDFGFCLKEIFAGEDFDEHKSVLGKGIHHVEVAAVEA